jgi:hypothetical protein
MDAYQLQQELFKAWQTLALTPNAAQLNKTWNETPVYVDGRQITGVSIQDGKILLETK